MSFRKRLLIGETNSNSTGNRNISNSQKLVDQINEKFSEQQNFQQKHTNQKEHHQPKCAVDHRSLNHGTLTTIRWSSCNCNCGEVYPEKPSTGTTYKGIVATSDILGAGTDAKVKVILIDCEGAKAGPFK